MHISRLALDHYRSWERCVLDFEPGVNILQGANGLGKTNIVEAVEVLSTGSSHRTSSSLPLIERGCASATIRANVEDDRNRHSYEVTIAARGANRARIDGGNSLYMRDVIGKIPPYRSPLKISVWYREIRPPDAISSIRPVPC